LKTTYGGKFGVYRIADCVPIREAPQAAPTAKQACARAMLAVKAKLRSNAARAGAEACAWLGADPLFLDTETTGLDGAAQIIELALVDSAGRVVLGTRVRPSVPVDPDAFAVHGIDDAALASAPSWPEVIHQVKAAVAGRLVVIFNDEFDARMVRQTCAAFGEPAEWWNAVETRCAMYLAADAFGSTNNYGSMSLAAATYAAGVQWPGAAHSAAVDALVTAELVKAIAAISSELEAEC
jgi:DNA polymerase-3 subunit epsilon